MEVEWVIVGFDLREVHENHETIFSIDTSIWKSVIESEDPGLPLTEWVGPRHDHWESLSHLETFISNYPPGRLPACWLIAIAQITEELEQAEPAMFARTLAYSTPNVPADNWEILGYDVGDYFLSSATVLGKELSERNHVMAGDLGEISRSGLFKQLKAAQEFQRTCNEKMTDRSPFFIYAIYLLSKYDPLAKWQPGRLIEQAAEA